MTWIFKPGACLVFVELLLSVNVCMRVCVCVCVSAPKAIINWWCDVV